MITNLDDMYSSLRLKILPISFVLLYIIVNPARVLSGYISIRDFLTDLPESSYKNFEIIRFVHNKAISENLEIDYEGIDTIRLDIPTDASSIPVPQNIDFRNVVFIVNNKTRDFALFEYSNELISLAIDKKEFQKFDFSSIQKIDEKKNYSCNY